MEGWIDQLISCGNFDCAISQLAATAVFILVVLVVLLVVVLGYFKLKNDE